MWTIVAGALVALGAGLAAAFIWRRWAIPKEIGFREYVRKPRLRSRISAHLERRKDIVRQMAELPAPTLASLLLNDTLWLRADQAIELRGAEMAPHLCALAETPEARRRLTAEEKEASHGPVRRNEPLESILRRIGDIGDASCVPTVSRFVHDPYVEIREAAAYALGAIGDSSGGEPLRRCLEAAEDGVAAGALRGLNHAIRHDRLDPGLAGVVFPAVARLVWTRSFILDNPAEVLLGLDRRRALETLFDGEQWRPDSKFLASVLDTLRKHGVAPPESLLRPIIKALQTTTLKWPNHRMLGDALVLAANHRAPWVDDAIAFGLASDVELVRSGAAEAVLLRAGVVNPFDAVYARLEGEGQTSLSIPQRRWYAVRCLVNEVCNGGFQQYFVNSSGDSWRDALDGLDEMGLTATAALVRRAIEPFGPGGPSEDGDKRHRQLARIVNANSDVFEPIEEEFFRDEEFVDAALSLYAARHAEHFRHESADRRSS